MQSCAGNVQVSATTSHAIANLPFVSAGQSLRVCALIQNHIFAWFADSPKLGQLEGN
jgi:hypothetical protein